MTRARAEEAVRRLPNARPDGSDPTGPGSSFFTVEDGRHVIEIEVATPVRVSCRFTLCHPPSVDAAFLGLVTGLMTRLGMEAWICDDVLPQHGRGFPPGQAAEFADVASGYIAKRRTEWVARFGPAQLAAGTAEVFEKLILPRCEPVAG